MVKLLLHFMVIMSPSKKATSQKPMEQNPFTFDDLILAKFGHNGPEMFGDLWTEVSTQISGNFPFVIKDP